MIKQIWNKFRKHMSTAAHGGRDTIFDPIFNGYDLNKNDKKENNN